MVRRLRRRTPVALLNLLGNPTQAMISISGVGFALLLIFVQLGFRGAVANTATIVYSKLDFDLVARSPEYLHLYEPRTIATAWLDLIASHPDVVSVKPFYIMLNKWQSPNDGHYRAMGMMGIRRDMNVFPQSDIESQLDKLANHDWALIDTATRKDYGPVDDVSFSERDVGRTAELGNSEIRIAGLFHVGTGLATNGAVLLSDVGYGKRSGLDVRKTTNLGLITLRDGADKNRTAEQIRRWLRSEDTRSEDSIVVLSRDEAVDWEHRRWLGETPIGIVFQLGAILAFVVGMAIVYMVLATDIQNRMSEYATLKAIGYSSWFISWIVLKQAWILAVCSYIPAWILSEVLYAITESLAGIPLNMTADRALFVAILALLMVTASGTLAIRKLWRAEPATLFV